MKLYHSFTNNSKSLEAIKKQFDNVPQHWINRMSRYNWKIAIVDELYDEDNGDSILLNVACKELTIYLNSSMPNALLNGIYKCVAGYILVQHMNFRNSVIFQSLLENSYDQIQIILNSSPESTCSLFIELFSFVIETKCNNTLSCIAPIYQYVKQWVTGDIFERKIKHIPDYIIADSDVVDENISNVIEIFSKIPTKIQKEFLDSGWEISISSEYINGMPDCEGCCVITSQTIYIQAAANNLKTALWHEIGHFIDFQRNFPSDSWRFSRIFEKEKNYLLKEQISLDSYVYSISDKQEYFAESFANYMDHSLKLKSIAPRTHKFIKKIVR